MKGYNMKMDQQDSGKNSRKGSFTVGWKIRDE
jgi:hypothetical protein